MSATLADPYRAYAIDYSQHGNCKAEEHEELLAFQSRQAQIHHDKQSEVPFPPTSSHRPVFEQHQHASAGVLPSIVSQPTVHDLSQTVMLGPHQMLSRQLPPQYHHASLEASSTQRGKKRSHAEIGEEEDDDDGSHGIRPHLPLFSTEASTTATHSPELLFSVQGDPSQHHQTTSGHGFSPQGSSALPQQHHHHRLPPNASLPSAQYHGMSDASPPLASGPPSVVGQPGMPDPAPRPRGPKLKFTPEEDALLVELKENKNLTWKQIADFFPGRTSGTLQVRYCTKLKAKDVIWTDEMAHRLQRAIQEYENDRWRIIAGKVGNGFTPAACREKATEL
ncbi:hypothetical protein ASPWEDRAFT_49063 [Aspergillus wentii DTO 134E9]|uniref:Myb-like domain-containing protein n=1 Tax=Aspergillus wentii DTO 134E9 TaxID=1073089 RepID=A0A1L9RVR2_ASPWE|nr:uncharacterized protein ASPWEDRAFT_49063 [Aspergillus wentii DTO 134E9]KAI9928869.1 hypothetical protein MW887_002092 [Aspergillus wentii]OJJ38974.1 hypothetical protein ASPWEDRAFT_49063 [Aspergillus wentii DTO 134E9]